MAAHPFCRENANHVLWGICTAERQSLPPPIQVASASMLGSAVFTGQSPLLPSLFPQGTFQQFHRTLLAGVVGTQLPAEGAGEKIVKDPDDSGLLSVPDIDSYVGLMHTLFTLEDNYGLKVTEQDGELALQVDFRKNKDAARLHEMLWTWREQAAKLEAGEISQEEYDRWRYHYPEYDSSQVRAKMPPEGLI